jgi:hypothetical protein
MTLTFPKRATAITDMEKQILRQTNRPVSNEIHFPKNPLERLNQMRNKL